MLGRGGPGEKQRNPEGETRKQASRCVTQDGTGVKPLTTHEKGKELGKHVFSGEGANKI